MSNALTFDPSSRDDLSLDLYYREVSRFPLLTAAEELDLARRFAAFGDVAAAHRLVTGNLRFVVKIAMEYRRYGFRLLDLIQEGNVGLMRAVQKFDPERGFRLISYAVWWIRAHIHDFILRSWSLVRIGTTRVQRKLFNRLQSAQKRLRALIGTADDRSLGLNAPPRTEDEQLARDLDVPVDEVVLFRQRVRTPDASLDEPIFGDGEERSVDRLPALGVDQEAGLVDAEAQAMLSQRLEAAVADLNERDQLIVRLRLLADTPLTLNELGERLGISKERVRQLENRVKERLRAALGDVAAEYA